MDGVFACGPVWGLSTKWMIGTWEDARDPALGATQYDPTHTNANRYDRAKNDIVYKNFFGYNCGAGAFEYPQYRVTIDGLYLNGCGTHGLGHWGDYYQGDVGIKNMILKDAILPTPTSVARSFKIENAHVATDSAIRCIPCDNTGTGSKVQYDPPVTYTFTNVTAESGVNPFVMSLASRYSHITQAVEGTDNPTADTPASAGVLEPFYGNINLRLTSYFHGRNHRGNRYSNFRLWHAGQRPNELAPYSLFTLVEGTERTSSSRSGNDLTFTAATGWSTTNTIKVTSATAGGNLNLNQVYWVNGSGTTWKFYTTYAGAEEGGTTNVVTPNDGDLNKTFKRQEWSENGKVKAAHDLTVIPPTRTDKTNSWVYANVAPFHGLNPGGPCAFGDVADANAASYESDFANGYVHPYPDGRFVMAGKPLGAEPW